MQGVFPGSDQAAVLARRASWSDTPLGDPRQWGPELRAAIRTVLPSQMPMLLWWGDDLVQIYNDAYRRLLGGKHPLAMGQLGAECWPEAWDQLGPIVSRVRETGEAFFGQDLLLFVERHGYLEETYWTLSYSPIWSSDGQVVGILVATTDVTLPRVDARRLETVRSLAVLSSADFPSSREIVDEVATILTGNRQAMPFAAVYLTDSAGDLHLRAHYGAALPAGPLPERVNRASTHPVAEVCQSLDPVLALYSAGELETDPSPLGPKTPDAAYLMPLGGVGRPVHGVLVLGLNPYRYPDARYLTFVTLVARQVSALLTDVRVAAAERARSATLAELDRSKSTFFANVSHEFRTPLTIALAAARELAHSGLSDDQSMHVDAIERAAGRLNRLVDALLDFARAEAGSLTLALEPVDVAVLTRDVVSMFQSAIESAGLELDVDLSSASTTVMLDRESWVNIVANLVSNAYKFTDSAGTIRVALRHELDQVTLVVSNTGEGLGDAETARVFERFHQVTGNPARGIPGTGIGLALVKDLATAHGGRVWMDSVPAVGTTVSVSLPIGPSADSAPVQLPLELSAAVAGLVDDLRPPSPDPVRADQTDASRPLLLVVEDNPDLRVYLSRLLTADGWRVAAAADVHSALQTEPVPDLVLCDVMLPGSSGLDLVRLLRQDEQWGPVPIVLLTARSGAGEVAEGLGAGANDYVSKPFEPVELLSRLRTHYELTRGRNRQLTQAEERASQLQTALTTNRQIGMAVGVLMARHQLTSEAAFELLRRQSTQTNRKLRDIAERVVLTGQLPQTARQT